MDRTRPDTYRVKPEPASPAGSHESDHEEVTYPEIKIESCYPDFPIEYDQTAKNVESENVKFSEVYIKQETSTTCPDLSELHATCVKTEPELSAEDAGDHILGDVDVSHPDIKKECCQSSNGSQPPRRTFKTSAERAREYRARKRAKKPPKKPPKTRLQRNREWRQRKKLQAKMQHDQELCFTNPSASTVPSTTIQTVMEEAKIQQSASLEHNIIFPEHNSQHDAVIDVHKTNLKQAKRTTQREKKIAQTVNECEECKKTFKLRNNLKIHMLSHTGEKPYACSECDYKCSRSDVLKSHMLTHFGEKSFSCSQCSYTCFKKSNLKHHMLSHTGEKPFSCSNCSYKCSRKDVLKSHMLTHTGEKPFSCTVCSYSCIRKGNLKYHMLSHTGEKPFSCSECSYTCFKKRNLQYHTLSHTGEKPFSCSECSYRCCRNDMLKSHMITHTGEKLFSCSDCSHTYTTKGCLKYHKLTHAEGTPFSE